MEKLNLAMDNLTNLVTYGSLILLSAFVSYLIIRAAVSHGIKDSKTEDKIDTGRKSSGRRV